METGHARRTGIGVGLGLLAGAGLAASSLHLTLDRLRYGPVTLDHARAAVTPDQGYRLAVRTLRLPHPPWRIERLSLTCPGGAFHPPAMACPDGRLTLHLPRLGQRLSAALSARLAPTRGRVRLDPIRFAGGRWRLEADYRGSAWRARLKTLAQPLNVSWIKPLSPRMAWLARLAGDLRLDLVSRGSPAPEGLDLRLTGTGLTFSDPDFARAAERLAVHLHLQGRRQQRAGTWDGTLELAVPQGEGLHLPIYLPFGDHPVRLAGRFSWQPETAGLVLRDLRLTQRDVLAATAEARLGHGTLSTLTAGLRAELPAAFRLYGHPFLEGGDWEGIGIPAGRLRGRLALERRRLERARLHLDGVVLTDRQRRLGINRLEASLVWQRSLTGSGRPFPVSRMRWHAGHLYAIPVGAAELFFRLTGDDFRLLLPADLPVLDGHLFIDRLEMLDLATTPRIGFSGRIDRISLDVLTRVLGWPPLAGTLSGTIPKVTYDHRRRTLRLDGRLEVEVFDGTLVIEHLVVTDLFGVLPRLEADVRFHNLDLERVTGHFAFGRITGRLDGHIRRLHLENWRPVSFEAWFGTPPGDTSRHRISQKAVENLASLGGGGAAGVLSRTLLRLFKEFGYNRIGLGCRLRDNVCELSGVAAAPNGYYIVRGGGLPRIDVIGYNRRIDWPTLLTRLARITQIKQLESPIVQP